MTEDEAIRRQYAADLAAFGDDVKLIEEAREVSARVAEEEAWLEALSAELRHRNLQDV